MKIHHLKYRGLEQTLFELDIESISALTAYQRHLESLEGPFLVYSDPPWNPGNATYWRTHAGKAPCYSYARFLDSWVAIGAECQMRGTLGIFTEQSANPLHKQLLLDAVARHSGWTMPLIEEWTVYYGSPGSQSVRRPNTLLHFGREKLRTDPSGMAGESMTIRACAGLAQPIRCVIDPCMGKGMTSRMAHYFGWNCIGSEINPKRLEVARRWLRTQGYTERMQEL